MVKYLINLSRFVSDNEKKQIIKELIKRGYNVYNDSWSSKRIISNKLIDNKPYVANIIILKETFSPKTISETISRLKKYKVSAIKSKIWKGVPFHEKAIKERFLKKNNFDKSGDLIYLEAKMKNDLPIVRIGVYLLNHKDLTIQYPDLAIETPYTIGEISDFVRMSKTFKSKLYIITNNDKYCLNAIDNFLKSNSFNKANVQIIKSIEILKSKYEFIGFSLWGKTSISSLQNKKNMLFLFGNERRGLLKNTMDLCSKIIKIGNSSEPLRATQAAAFAFGFISRK